MPYLKLFLVFILFPVSVLASGTRYYDVELIIFEHMQPENRRAEHWQKNIEREIPELFIELNGELPEQLNLPEGYIPKLSFKKLPSTTYQLTDEVTAIEKSTSRRVLLHTSWVQPGLSQKSSVNVHLNKIFHANNNEEFGNNVHQQDIQTSTMIAGSGSIDALIRISLARYLHIETDLLLSYDEAPANDIIQAENVFSIQTSDTNIEEITNDIESPVLQPLPTQFHIKQSRNRIRSTELHYLDHPLVGLLIIFTKHEVEIKAPPEDKTKKTNKTVSKKTKKIR